MSLLERSRAKRPESTDLVDLHVYLVPHNIWRERYNNFLNQNVTETVSAGIIRVHPEQKVIVLREEIDNQIGAELVPREYVFLKSVGRSITKLKAKQEYQLKVKNFIPPQSYAPELFLLEAQDVDSSRSSVRPESPDYNTGRKSDRTPYTSHNTNPTSPEYNMSSAENLASRHAAGGKHNYPSPYHHSPIPKIPTKHNPDNRRYEAMEPDSHSTPDDVINNYSSYQTPARGRQGQSPSSREDGNDNSPPPRRERVVNRSHDPAGGRDSDTPTHLNRHGRLSPQRMVEHSRSPARGQDRSRSPERNIENSRSPARNIDHSRSPARLTQENVRSHAEQARSSPRYTTENDPLRTKPPDRSQAGARYSDSDHSQTKPPDHSQAGARYGSDNDHSQVKPQARDPYASGNDQSRPGPGIDDENVATPPRHPGDSRTLREQKRGQSPSNKDKQSYVQQGQKASPATTHQVQTNGINRPLSASSDSDQDFQKSPSPQQSRPPPGQKPKSEAVSGPPLSATPPPLAESSRRPVAAGNKYDPRLETYTNHTNEDSGIAGLTPDDHYRENQDDILDRRKQEEEEKRRREAELQSRLKAEQETQQRKSHDDRDKEWERHEKLEEERRRKDEEERRRREEEKRKKEEEEKRREEEEEARREEERKFDRLSASDESTRTKIEPKNDGHLTDRSLVLSEPDRTSTPKSVKVIVKVNGNLDNDTENVSNDEKKQTVFASDGTSIDVVYKISPNNTEYHMDNSSLHKGQKSRTEGQGPIKGDGDAGSTNTSNHRPETQEGHLEGQGHSGKDNNKLTGPSNATNNYKSNTGQALSDSQGYISDTNSLKSRRSQLQGQSEHHDYKATNVADNQSKEEDLKLEIGQGGQLAGQGYTSDTNSYKSGKGQSQSVGENRSENETISKRQDSGNHDINDNSNQSNKVGYQNENNSVGENARHQVHPSKTGPVLLTNEEPVVEPKKVPSGSNFVGQATGNGQTEPTPSSSQNEGVLVSGNNIRITPNSKRKEVSWSDDVLDNESDIDSLPKLAPAPDRIQHERPGTYIRPQSSFKGPRQTPVIKDSGRQSRSRTFSRAIPRIQLDSGSSSSSPRDEGQLTSRASTHRPGWKRKSDHTHVQHHSSNVPRHPNGYQADTSDLNSDWNEPPTGNELNRFPSPPPLKISTPPNKERRESRGGADTDRSQQGKTEKEQLMRELEQAREARKTLEKHREDLVKKAKMLQNKMQNRRNHARDLWKKRYFEEKKRTSPLEEQCNRLRHELEIIHRKLMNTLEGPNRDKTTQKLGDLKPSIQSNYKIQAARLMHEIEDIRRRLENAKMKLTAEMKLRNQAETELRAMRAELTQKKINRTLTRHQQFGSTLSVSDPYLNRTAISPRS